MKLDASQYAEIVLSLSLKDEALEQFAKSLYAFSVMIRENKTLRSYLLDPTVSREDQEKWITSVSDNQFARFLQLVVKNGDVEKLELIHKHLEDIRSKNLEVVKVVITSAAPLSKESKQLLEKVLAKKIGKDIEAVHEVDEKLLGGVRIQIGDKIIDDSVLGKITQLKKELAIS